MCFRVAFLVDSSFGCYDVPKFRCSDVSMDLFLDSCALPVSDLCIREFVVCAEIGLECATLCGHSSVYLYKISFFC